MCIVLGYMYKENISMVISKFQFLVTNVRSQYGHKRPGHKRLGQKKGGHKRPGHKRPGHKRPGHKRLGHKRPASIFKIIKF